MKKKEQLHPLAQFLQEGKKQQQKKPRQRKQKPQPNPFTQFLGKQKGVDTKQTLSPARPLQIQPLIHTQRKKQPTQRKPLLQVTPPRIESIFKMDTRQRKRPSTWQKQRLTYPQAFKQFRLPPVGDRDKDGVMNLFDCRPYNPRMQHPFVSDEQRKAVMASLEKQEDKSLSSFIQSLQGQHYVSPLYGTSGKTTDMLEEQIEQYYNSIGKKPPKKGSIPWKRDMFYMFRFMREMSQEEKDKRIAAVMKKDFLDIVSKIYGKKITKGAPEFDVETPADMRKFAKEMQKPEKKKKEREAGKALEKALDDLPKKTITPMYERFKKEAEKEYTDQLKDLKLKLSEHTDSVEKLQKEQLRDLQRKQIKAREPTSPADKEKYRAKVKIGSGFDTDASSPMSSAEAEYWEKEIPYDEIVVAEDKFTGKWRLGDPSKYEYKRRIAVPAEDKDKLLKDMHTLKTDPRVKILY